MGTSCFAPPSRSCTCMRSHAETGRSPKAAPWSSTQGCTRAGRRRTSSSCRSRPRLIGSGGARSTRRSRRITSSGLREKVTTRLGEQDVYVVDAFAGADHRAPHRGARRHREPMARAVREDALHRSHGGGARALRAGRTRPACAVRLRVSRRGRHQDEHVRRPAPVAARGRDRRHLLRGRDQEVDLHAHERPSPASGRSSHALLCERGRGRSRRGVLRALRDREDDALGRPGTPPRRRRRARLERRRDLQHRRRLLREGDQALREGRAPDLPDDPNLRHRARERRRRRAGRPRPRRRLEDREHARRVQARADRATRCQSSGPGIRPRSSSSLPTRSGSSLRSRG